MVTPFEDTGDLTPSPISGVSFLALAASTPPHGHPRDEAFYVIDGEVIFGVCADHDLVAASGTLVHVSGGSTHWLHFSTGGGGMIAVTSHDAKEVQLATPLGLVVESEERAVAGAPEQTMSPFLR